MKLRLFPYFALLGIVACSFADESRVGSIVSLGVDDIQAGRSSLEGWDYVSTGQPDAEVLSLARDAGFTTVVDLRTESEDRGIDEMSAVTALGMHYVSLPVSGADDVSFENAQALDEILANSDGPVLLHCASGNRVGALFALREKLAGATNEEALAAGKVAGLTRLEGAVKERLQEHQP